jgi:hypothetical protein
LSIFWIAYPGIAPSPTILGLRRAGEAAVIRREGGRRRGGSGEEEV